MLPVIRPQGSGHVINVSSIGGKIWEPMGSWYHATKFAVEGLSDSLRVEVKPFGTKVIVIEPGLIRNEWAGIAADGLIATSDSAGGGAPIILLIKHILSDRRFDRFIGRIVVA